MDYDPISVALKFGFLAVLYLFLLWVARSARKDLVRSQEPVLIDDPNVSRHHAELRPSGDGWAVHDLGSTNGIKVNGRRRHEQLLGPGDEITLGLTKLKFELE